MQLLVGVSFWSRSCSLIAMRMSTAAATDNRALSMLLNSIEPSRSSARDKTTMLSNGCLSRTVLKIAVNYSERPATNEQGRPMRRTHPKSNHWRSRTMKQHRTLPAQRRSARRMAISTVHWRTINAQWTVSRWRLSKVLPTRFTWPPCAWFAERILVPLICCAKP